MVIFNNLDELITDHINNDIFLTEKEIEEIHNCSMVIEDLVPSGNYEILADKRILVY